MVFVTRFGHSYIAESQLNYFRDQGLILTKAKLYLIFKYAYICGHKLKCQEKSNNEMSVPFALNWSHCPRGDNDSFSPSQVAPLS